MYGLPGLLFFVYSVCEGALNAEILAAHINRISSHRLVRLKIMAVPLNNATCVLTKIGSGMFRPPLRAIVQGLGITGFF